MAFVTSSSIHTSKPLLTGNTRTHTHTHTHIHTPHYRERERERGGAAAKDEIANDMTMRPLKIYMSFHHWARTRQKRITFMN